MAVVKPVGGRRRKGASIRAARIRRLRERLETEQDPKVRAMVLAQLAAFGQQVQP